MHVCCNVLMVQLIKLISFVIPAVGAAAATPAGAASAACQPQAGTPHRAGAVGEDPRQIFFYVNRCEAMLRNT